jgi:Glycosyltransferases involved in cell wall biogenesis
MVHGRPGNYGLGVRPRHAGAQAEKGVLHDSGKARRKQFDFTSSSLPKTPFVSVIVCSYNGGHTLAACLDSLGKLNYPAYEVILVDDGSTDDTAHVAAQFPSVRTFIRPIMD